MGRKCICVTVFWAIVSTLALATCSAGMGRSNQRILSGLKNDSIVRQAVGDSIFTFISKAKIVEMSLLTAPQDSLAKSESIKLNRSERGILGFVLCDIRNFQSNDTVYGKFQPTLRITYKRKMQICILNFDMGLGKWNICDKNGVELRRYDLEAYNLLRFACMMFPEDEFINELLKTM